MKELLTGRRTRYSKNLHRIWSFAIAVPVLMLAVQLGACAGPSINEEPDPGVRENTAQSATVEEILGNSDAFYGAEVTVTGEVTEVISPLTFELDGEVNADSTRYGESADGLLVVKNLESTSDPEVEVGETVEVTGTVREFNIQALEDEINGELADGVFTYWAGQSSMVATSVERSGETTNS